MKYLVYGILPETAVSADLRVPGLEGEWVRFIHADGLAAACSPRPQAETTPEVPRLLAYAGVIEALSRQGAILPMRYGCWLSNEAEVIELLCRKGSTFTAALREVDGCVEMGVRVMSAQTELSVVLERGKPAPALTNGSAYLARRQAHFAAQDQGRLEAEGLTEIIRSAFGGLFVKFQAEGGTGHYSPLLSLHFLIRADQVEPFRETFRRLQETWPQQLLLSGPWPPYNFVAM